MSGGLAGLLRPTLLDGRGPGAGFGWPVPTPSEPTELRISFVSALDEQRLHPDVETLLFRITQEALTNVIRHSAARSARIVIKHTPMLLILRIEDDGHGFDTAQVAQAERSASSPGLRGQTGRASWRERVSQYG